MGSLFQAVLIGTGATLFMDLYALGIGLLGLKSLDYRFVGRWIGHFPKGKFFHQTILQASPVKYELILGWITHYVIGITFALLLVAFTGKKWLESPSIAPALLVGMLTIVAPFLVMQPAFGFGVAGSNFPDPNKARFMSMITHGVYGTGLYLSALGLNEIMKIG